MNTLERLRRERQSVCSHCGWGAVLMEDNFFECVNANCVGYRERLVILKAITRGRVRT